MIKHLFAGRAARQAAMETMRRGVEIPSIIVGDDKILRIPLLWSMMIKCE